MTYLQGVSSHKSAEEEEEEMRRRSSTGSQYPPCLGGGLEVVRRGLVHEDVDEHQAAGLQPARAPGPGKSRGAASLGGASLTTNGCTVSDGATDGCEVRCAVAQRMGAK
jgi:hypothetical protein